nr:hypothetical protein [Tanacetum cinerariifolium]
ETIESLKSKGFESSDKVCSESENQSENDCLVVEKEFDKKENPKVIAPGMLKLNVSQRVSPILMSKSSCDSKNVEIKLKRKRRKRKSSKQNVKQVDNDVSRANSDFIHFSDLDTFSSVRRPKNRSVIWKKKGSSNVRLSAVSVLNLNKNVKRYSRKDLLACNNSHIGETRSNFVCNDAMHVSCDSRMNDLLDDNNFFIFDDVNVRISHVSKMGACVFTDKWSLDDLANGVLTDGPYQTNPPSPDGIISLWKKLFKKTFSVWGLLNESYVLYDRVMNPLTAHQERKTRKDRGTRRGHHSTSSSSAFDQPSYSHLNDDNDENGEGTSRARTPSPIRFVNFPTNDVPQVFQNPPNIDPHRESFYTR